MAGVVTKWIVIFGILLGVVFAQAQSPETAKKDPFTEESLKLRTALHYDSAIGAPLDSLVRLYQKEKREEELVGLYQAHIAKYPDDAGAKAVLARILTALERSEVDEFIQSAAQQHPEFSHLQYLLSQNLKKKDEIRSLEALSKAIDLEKGKSRRSAWLGELLDRSRTEKGRELATMQLKKLLLVEGQTGPTMLSLGQVMQRHQFWELSLVALQRALSLRLNPEQGIEASILAAKAEAAIGKTAEAGLRLEGVLGKLAADHHRRNEVMSFRVSVAASDEEREKLLQRSKTVYEKTPGKETAILDYTEILIASGRADEALRILQKGSGALPESTRIEMGAIELLEKKMDVRALISFLNSRLELRPERPDLRYRIVKAHYQNNDSLAAEQDFELVLGSLSDVEKSARILDLARFLRSIEKGRIATRYYENFLKLHPSRLDVTRELCEIFLENGLVEKIKATLATAKATGAEQENVLDLAHFLIEEHFFGPAEKMLKEFVSGTRVPPFEPGLYLVRALGELGKRDETNSLLEKLREEAESPSRYKSWLLTAMLVNDGFESVDSFFAAEQSKFPSSESNWSPERIEKFLYLCEAGERRQLTERVSLAIQQRLGMESIDSKLKIKLRQLLVRTLERNPEKASVVEEQLKILGTEDPARLNQYNLRRALLYHNVQRPDLSREVLEGLDLNGVDSPGLLRDSYRMLMEFGDRELAGIALETVTSLEPSDLFSWERRLSLLAAEGKESEFRAAIRSLLQGIAQRGKAAEWRDDTQRALHWHLLDSYWRSVAKVLSENRNLAETLPLLDGVERAGTGDDLLWTNWVRAHIYKRLGREKEYPAAIKSLEERLAVNPSEILSFPDGLSIPLKVAIEQLDRGASFTGNPSPKKTLPLLGTPHLNWAFEIDEGAVIFEIDAASDSLFILDNWGQIYRVDQKTGKLKWKKSFGVPGLPSKTTLAASPDSPESSVRKTRRFSVSGDRFLLAFERELRAFSIENGEPIWIADFRGTDGVSDDEPAVGAPPEVVFQVAGDVVVVFDPVQDRLSGFHSGSGKLLWENRFTVSAKNEANGGGTAHKERLVSMNTGLSVRNGRVMVYGKHCGIFEAATGREMWRFNSEEVRVFPVILREQREDLSEEELVTLEQNNPPPVWIPVRPGSRRQNLNYLDQESGFEK